MKRMLSKLIAKQNRSDKVIEKKRKESGVALGTTEAKRIISYCNESSWVQMPVSSLPDCVTLNKLSNFSRFHL